MAKSAQIKSNRYETTITIEHVKSSLIYMRKVCESSSKCIGYFL